MPAASRRIRWDPPVPDPQRALVQAYTRLILQHAQVDGIRTAVIASFPTRDLRLVEILPADAPPEEARLRVELYDRLCGRSVESVACADLQEAEAATKQLMTDPGNDRPSARPLVLAPIRPATGSAGEEGVRVEAGGRLVAVLVRLSAECRGEDLAGGWHLEAGFDPCVPDEDRVFATLEEAEAWFCRRLAERN
ncbi:hypothetical protein [Methylobacterium oxalidis]|uniref:Uncharacterized protein n=1 Tax=Methylobacterium oxalidis TaxID=944322 RepID=A0A512IYV5_9HYPH|nr:hypothetical protein [Methylobacterium oxalidis]GEP02896.1 hypothetical protein MOX02_09340 [Methylobacterium oxalidis]GJE30315.1 hypothetical protein LDDCCGHA_0482 [Methylobacterium oxalidis]GLS65829.1 hypothetical protein GCM10007888_42110 [Methylobacterium oxalidis]